MIYSLYFYKRRWRGPGNVGASFRSLPECNRGRFGSDDKLQDRTKRWGAKFSTLTNIKKKEKKKSFDFPTLEYFMFPC